jgi:hypothetical protein
MDAGTVCPSCSKDNAQAFKSANYSETIVHSMMLEHGAAYHAGLQALFLPLRDGEVASITSLAAPSNRQLKDLHGWIVRWCKFSRKMYTQEDAFEYLNSVREGQLVLPRITSFSSRPMLLKHEDGHLFAPTVSGVRDRLFESEELFYTGEGIVPNDTDWFDRWMDTFKVNNEESRRVVEQYVLTALLQRLLPPGSMPMLVFAAADSSAGKTTTAEMILGMFGQGVLQVPWDKVRNSMEGVPRMLMDPRYAGLVFDNLASVRPNIMVSSSGLAAITTREALTVMRLYESIGSVALANHYLYLATANNPKLVTELFNRSIFCELDDNKPQCEDWKATWLAPERKALVLGSAVRRAMDNWAKGNFPCDQPQGYRFNDWYRTAARLLQAEPVIVPRGCSVIAPIDLALETVWGYYGGEADDMKLETALEHLNTGAGSALKEFREQGLWSVARAEYDLDKYGTKFNLFTKEGESWISPKSANTSPKSNVR